MRYVVLICLGCCLLLSGCKETDTPEVVIETEAQIEAKTISAKDIENIRYTDFGLSPESEKAVADWQKFQELSTQVEALKSGDLTAFEGDRLLLSIFFQEFETEMPKTLKTNEILARITALNTKAQKLNSLLSLHNIEKEERLKAIKELLIAVSNLNLQINKKFEFEKNNRIAPE